MGWSCNIEKNNLKNNICFVIYDFGYFNNEIEI